MIHLYSVQEVASFLRVSRHCVYRLIQRKELRSVRAGRLHRIPSTAVHEYLRSRAAGQ